MSPKLQQILPKVLGMVKTTVGQRNEWLQYANSTNTCAYVPPINFGTHIQAPK